MFQDRVKETTTTTGTGDFTTAGAVTGFQSLNTAFGVGPQFPYTATDNVDWEVGIGHLSAATTMVRDVVLRSSNGDALVNFAAGSKDLFCTIPASEASTRGRFYARYIGFALP